MIQKKLTEALGYQFQRSCFVFNDNIYLEGFKKVISVPSVNEYYQEMLNRTGSSDRAFSFVYDAVSNLFYGSSVVRDHEEELRNEG